MRRADTLLMVVVGAFALFVGVRVAHTPRKTAPRSTPQPTTGADTTTRSTPRTSDQPPASPTTNDVALNVTRTATAAPARNVDDIRARIAATPGTYMPSMLSDLNEQLVRWPDRREQGLRIWVQSITPVRDWNLRYAQMARDAFADWGSGGDGAGVPIRLDFVLDSATSDVQIMWLERFAPELGRRVGNTRRTTDQNGWLVSAQIVVAIHDSAGRTIPPDDLAGIVRHEAGHALGLGHSADPNTKMFPVERVSDIRPADRATLRLLYQLPPGLVR